MVYLDVSSIKLLRTHKTLYKTRRKKEKKKKKEIKTKKSDTPRPAYKLNVLPEEREC